MAEQDQLLTPGEVSARLTIPEGTLSQWRHRSVGPPYLKIGKHVRYRESDCEAWLAQQYASSRVSVA